MTCGAFIDYVVRHLKQFIYVRYKKKKKKKGGTIRKYVDIKGKVSLYFNWKTFRYNQWCPRLHLQKHSVQAVPSKKKKEERKESEMEINGRRPEKGKSRRREQKRDKGERQNEKKTEKREVEKRRRRKGMEGV